MLFWKRGARETGWGSSLSRAALLWMISGSLVIGAIGGRSQAGEPPSAASNPALQPSPAPLDLNALTASPPPSGVVTATTISDTGITTPSLWWMKQQYAAEEQFAGKLLENWLAYPGQERQPGRVDFVVNRQLWSLLDYLERYTFIHDFGTVARDYGYNIRIFDDSAKLLATYTCDFSTINLSELQRRALERTSAPTPAPSHTVAPGILELTDTIPCQIQLDSSGKAGFRGRPSQPIP